MGCCLQRASLRTPASLPTRPAQHNLPRSAQPRLPPTAPPTPTPPTQSPEPEKDRLDDMQVVDAEHTAMVQGLISSMDEQQYERFAAFNNAKLQSRPLKKVRMARRAAVAWGAAWRACLAPNHACPPAHPPTCRALEPRSRPQLVTTLTGSDKVDPLLTMALGSVTKAFVGELVERGERPRGGGGCAGRVAAASRPPPLVCRAAPDTGPEPSATRRHPPRAARQRASSLHTRATRARCCQATSAPRTHASRRSGARRTRGRCASRCGETAWVHRWRPLQDADRAML